MWIWIERRRALAMAAAPMPMLVTAALLLSCSRAIFWSVLVFAASVAGISAAYRVLRARTVAVLLVVVLAAFSHQVKALTCWPICAIAAASTRSSTLSTPIRDLFQAQLTLAQLRLPECSASSSSTKRWAAGICFHG